MTVLPACTYVYHIHAGAFRLQKKVSDTLEQMVVKHNMCADLCRSEDRIAVGELVLSCPLVLGIKLRLPDLSGRCPLTGPHAFMIILHHCLLFCVGLFWHIYNWISEDQIWICTLKNQLSNLANLFSLPTQRLYSVVSQEGTPSIRTDLYFIVSCDNRKLSVQGLVNYTEKDS